MKILCREKGTAKIIKRQILFTEAVNSGKDKADAKNALSHTANGVVLTVSSSRVTVSPTAPALKVK